MQRTICSKIYKIFWMD